jgi:very-short-patch-repair endonuclease
MTQIYNLYKQRDIRKRLRKSMPKGEVILWEKLKSNKLGYKFRRQYGVSYYVLDFYCPELHFGIEVDGLSHYGSNAKIIYDKLRQEAIESLGIIIKRFTSNEIFNDLERVMDEIHAICYVLSKCKYKRHYFNPFEDNLIGNNPPLRPTGTSPCKGEDKNKLCNPKPSPIKP